MYTYKILNGSVLIFVKDQDMPIINQPTNPNGSDWLNEVEMISWAEGWIYDTENLNYPTLDASSDS